MCSDPKSKAITSRVNGHIIFRMREMTDLLGSAVQGTQGNWVPLGEGGGEAQQVCAGSAQRAKSLEKSGLCGSGGVGLPFQEGLSLP